jgi:hypothetical protein
VTPGYAIAPDPAPLIVREDWAPRRTRYGRITTKTRDTIARLTRHTRQHHHQPPSRYDHDPDF